MPDWWKAPALTAAVLISAILAERGLQPYLQNVDANLLLIISVVIVIGVSYAAVKK